MSFITIVPVAPLRSEPSHLSEMSSQLLFGELCDVLDTAKDFFRVKCRYDGYEGWCQKSQLADFGEDDYSAKTGFIKEWNEEITINGISARVPFGSVISQADSTEFRIGPYRIKHQAKTTAAPPAATDRGIQIRANAETFLGTGYLWGGKSVFGADCSGFTQQVFKMAGVWLPRDSSQQALMGEAISFLQEAKTGDLAFFDNDEGRIIHVGIMLNDHEIIHSSGNVHIDRIDNEGIINSITGLRTHKLRIIKRFF